MSANSKAGDQLSGDQKTALRWDQQADHLARTQLDPAPDTDRDADMQDLWLETLQQ
jgi:spermidine/putrescine transport system substrate-binding protein